LRSPEIANEFGIRAVLLSAFSIPEATPSLWGNTKNAILFGKPQVILKICHCQSSVSDSIPCFPDVGRYLDLVPWEVHSDRDLERRSRYA
jgi:hypothetical protein